MKLNKMIASVMLLGLLCSVSLAQRARAGGVIPGARLPSAVNTQDNSIHIPGQSTVSPHSSVTPRTAHSRTATPTATTNPQARSVDPNTTTTVPDRVIVPDAHTDGSHTTVPPNQ